MPIGTSKLGVLGAGVVPGGTQTFNAPGTFSVPPGVSRVNITGKGGTGNPGNAGNSGNAGNPGTGGAGGSAGAMGYGCSFVEFGAFGGLAFFTVPGPGPGPFNVPCESNTNIAARTGPRGGPPTPSPNNNGPDATAGQAGQAGQAGTAGNPGNPGNTGSSSSGLCKTFPGGAGGTGGAGGAAGNGGSGGAAGGGGGGFQNRNPGSGGTGGGNGGAGAALQRAAAPPQGQCSLTVGGGGAGVTNSGQCGSPAQYLYARGNSPQWPTFTRAGGSGNPAVTATLPNFCRVNNNPSITTATMGGVALGSPPILAGNPSYTLTQILTGPAWQPGAPVGVVRTCFSQINCPTARPEIFRSGGGGAGVRSSPTPPCFSTIQMGGAGGGGGRGAAGNPGGASPTPSGSAATPQTFNCVPVTPGSPYPITVATPGGQIVISWNPQ